jgi:hypothetical protein
MAARTNIRIAYETLSFPWQLRALSALVPLRSTLLGDRFDFSFESVAMLTGPIEFGTGFAEVDGRSFSRE